MFGTPEVTTGGRALKFYSSLRIDVRKSEPIKNGTEIIGSHTRAKVVKNKVAPPFKQAEFDIIYGEGVSKIGALIDMGVNLDIITKSGAWFSYGNDRLGQGKENAKAALEKNPDMLQEIDDKIRAEILSGKGFDAVSDMDEDDIAEEKRKEAELEKSMKEEE